MNTDILWNIHLPVFKRKLITMLIDDEETGDSKTVIIQKDADNITP